VPKITKLRQHLLKLFRENYWLFFRTRCSRRIVASVDEALGVYNCLEMSVWMSARPSISYALVLYQNNAVCRCWRHRQTAIDSSEECSHWQWTRAV